jgi:hypothetical protein
MKTPKHIKKHTAPQKMWRQNRKNGKAVKSKMTTMCVCRGDDAFRRIARCVLA